jgi:hypothetical protein
MKVIVHGQTIENFRITVEDATGQVQEFDIAAELVVGEDLDVETRDAAAKEHFWSQIALDAERDLEEYDKTFYNTYGAHTERFARYYLKAQGDKNPTGTAKEKSASLLFSENVDEDGQKANAFIAYQAYIEEMAKVGVKKVPEADFRELMYSYEDPMEGIERMRLGMRYKHNQLKAVAAAFNTKSWSIKTLAADKRARLGANI